MKVYKCYRQYPSDSADVTIYVREWQVTGKPIVEFFPKNPLEEPFSRKTCETFLQGFDIAEEYIKEENFVKVEVGA